MEAALESRWALTGAVMKKDRVTRISWRLKPSPRLLKWTADLIQQAANAQGGGPTKATTLGVGSLLIASAVHFSSRGDGLSLHEILVTLFLFITAPVSAHLLSKAALHLRLRSLVKAPALVEEAGSGPVAGEQVTPGSRVP